MDPALEEQIDDTLDQDEVIEAIIRLTKRDQYPPGIMVVSSFDNIITCRVRRGDIQKVYDHPAVASFKAPRVFYHDWNEKVQTKENTRHPLLNENDFNPGLALTGKKVVIGLIDWGADFAHADFINEDGTTRFIALWDQNHPQNQMSPQPFGYGKMYNRDAINKALKTTTPYAALGYHPGIGDPKGRGMHGTHVMGIACANGRSGKKGIAPEAEIIFVHLGSSNTDGRFNLGDSGRLLEAIDFIRQTAGEKPLAINISAGKHGGPHDGCTLVEMCIDHFLEEHLNTAICQSTGNYFNASTHCSGLIRPGGMEEISFITGHTRVTENELEIWYSGKDEFGVGLQYENNSDIHICNLESSTEIKINGLTAGWMYHRSLDPNNKRNMVDIFLYPAAPVGKWRLTIYGERITDGRFHAWIERADQGQSKFSDANIIRTATTNTICNSNNSIVTGAYDQTDADYPVAPFSSSGPTLDGRLKPHILAPGINIKSSKSSPPNQQAGSNQVVQMSGTSMASPFITGVVALILQGIKKKATIFDIRNILFKSCTVIERTSNEDKLRGGYGIIDLQKIQKNIDWFNSHDLREASAKNKNTDAEYTFEEDETELQECGVDFFEYQENEPEIYAC